MAVPVAQIYSKNKTIDLVWDVQPDYKYFDVYLSMTGEEGTFSVIVQKVPNQSIRGKKLSGCSFLRSAKGLAESDTFYIALRGVDPSGVESAMGPSRMVPSNADQKVDAGTSQSPIVSSENLSRFIGANVQRLLFTQDVFFIEFFNNSEEEVLYVDITGVDATPQKSMPVHPKTYYTIYRHIPKDMGVSLVTGGGIVDARIVVHF
jgi:hypothetical protein